MMVNLSPLCKKGSSANLTDSKSCTVFFFFNFLSRWVDTRPPPPSGDNHMLPKCPIKGHLFLMAFIKRSSPSSITRPKENMGQQHFVCRISTTTIKLKLQNNSTSKPGLKVPDF